MKFNIETKTLLNAVNNVSKVIDKVSPLPALANLKICVEEKSIVITGSNGTASMQQMLSMESGVEECGQCLLPLYGLPMFPSCRNTIALLNIHCI